MPESPVSAATAPFQLPQLRAGEVLCGYRLVRSLVAETGEDTWLAHSAVRGGPSVVTLCSEGDWAFRRVTAHTRVRSAHVLAMTDIATTVDGRILLACEPTDWSLSTLLTSRSNIAAGEAVTILAPLAAGLAAIHEAGFSHGRLSAATILFSADGRPLIGGLDALQEDPISTTTADADRRPSKGVVSDFRVVGELIRAVARVVDDESRSGFVGVADWLDLAVAGGEGGDSLAGQLECRAFALAHPLPVVLVADRRPRVSEVEPRAWQSVRMRPTIASLWRAVISLPLVSPAVAALTRFGLFDWMRRVAHRKWPLIVVPLVVTALATSAGLAVIPRTNQQTPGGTPSPATRGERVETTSPRDLRTATTFTPEESATVGGEDAALAASALLALRARCAAARAETCVGTFAEPGSALDDADSHGFSAGSVTLLVDAESRARVELVQVYGDAVLTRAVPADEKSQPVLVLVVRTDTGWRLRDLFEPD